MILCGVDVGVTGAAVILDDTSLQVLAVLDLPVVRSKSLAWIDGAELSAWLRHWRPEIAVLELVTYWPGDSRKSNTVAMVRVSGGVEAILTAEGVPIVHCGPAAWKRRAGLIGRGKADSLSLARSRLAWPGGGLRLEKHEHRAEAALIALYGRAAAAPVRAAKRAKVVKAQNPEPGPLFEG